MSLNCASEGGSLKLTTKGAVKPRTRLTVKIINAASFGIPTVGYPELGYEEWVGWFPASTLDRLQELMRSFQVEGWDAGGLAMLAEEYHIDNIAPLYGGLL